MSNDNRILKVGLLVDSEIVSKYVFDLAKWGQKQENLKITHFIIQKKKEEPKNIIIKLLKKYYKKDVINLLNSIGMKIILKIELYKLKKNKIHFDHLKRYSLRDIVKESIEIEPNISKSGRVYRYPKKELKKISEQDFDILIRCGDGILKGEILEIVRFGVISLHHGDNSIVRGINAGFWEVLLQHDSSGFIIQQLTEELDAGNVLYLGRITTQPWYLLNQATIYLKANYFLKKILTEIAINFELPKKIETLPYCYPIRKNISFYIQFKYLKYLLWKLTNSLLDSYLCNKSGNWCVAYKYSDWKNLSMWNSVKIVTPPNHFYADPFVYSTEEEDYCFLEDYDKKTKRGSICVYRLFENKSEYVGRAIEESFHLSYPYLFEYNSKIYICPETSESNDIRIYECEEFPLKWKLKKILKSNVSATDSTIFKWKDRWWLFTNIDSLNIGDHCSELHIFSSDDPISDKWKPHTKNPVIVDSLKARMGGLLISDNEIYRVGQKQGFWTYGKSFSINKILRLTDDEYLESEFVKITPEFFTGLSGTHHIHSNGKITIFDYK